MPCFNRINFIILILAFLVVITTPCSQALAECSCLYYKWEQYRGVQTLRHPTRSAYIYIAKHVKVDSDGAPNAYHPDDIGLDCIKGKGFKGIDCPANAGYPRTSWWRTALLPDPSDKTKAFVQPSGDYAGFFVSQTSLQDKTKPAQDPARYVDSRSIPYIVFPGFFYKKKGTGKIGDLGYAVNLKTGAKSPFIVAETGPSDGELGEISIALANALGGQNPNPRTGEGIPKGAILYVVFPHSSRIPPWPLSASVISELSARFLEKVGGLDAALSCKDELQRED